ncbi:hypothetical protein WJX75_007042 [Coccomyxa subellipsoidea]|uniref:Uncharacterized protein n=1 Tax=Coccomyxa subellipsoidea TaxID=248742 RepID=A0ABR2Z265_9CHLO
MFPLVRGNDASDLPAAQKRKAEQIWSPTGSTAAGSAPAKPGNGGGETSGILEGHRVPSASLPDSASKVQAAPLLHLPEMPPPIRSNARLSADIQPQKQDSDGAQKQAEAEDSIAPPAASPAEACSQAKEQPAGPADNVSRRDIEEQKGSGRSVSPKELAENCQPFRDLEVLREKWRTFCDGVPSQPPPPPPRFAGPGPKPQAHAASSAAKGSAEPEEDQMSELPQCRASSLRAGSEGCIWDGASCVLDELREAELNWEEVIEEFMQPAVADEMSIIEQFMQPTGGEIASRADRDMYQYYMQRGQNAQRIAVSAGRA